MPVFIRYFSQSSSLLISKPLFFNLVAKSVINKSLFGLLKAALN
nr:MAG TPA: hypothetical protein [Bacteriophage sp.]